MLFNISLIGLLKLLPDTVHISLYADDICIWISSKSFNINRARLQKAIKIVMRYLKSRGLHISPIKSAAVAFTKRNTSKYPIYAEGTPMPYVPEHTFLGIAVNRFLIWGPHIKRLKNKLSSFTQLIQMISGTRWGCSVSATMTLYDPL